MARKMKAVGIILRKVGLTSGIKGGNGPASALFIEEVEKPVLTGIPQLRDPLLI
jgi:hypothetical protein